MKLILAATVALTLFTITIVSSLPPPVAATPVSFTFAASGDQGSLTSTTGAANLNLLHNTGADFYLSLGDMSYNPSTTGNTWCGQFKAKFNNIEILPGDHDTGGHPPGFNETRSYEKYLSGCPFNLNPTITCGPVEDACYGKEYYFDYPSGNPLARFISLSPKIFNITGQCTTCCSSQCSPSTPCSVQYDCWVYDQNTLHYNWTRSAIDDARNRGIKWVIVATHKVCISSSDATCSIGIDLFNLLVSKKVDLIIQAHDNAYERSKQLALSSTCTRINTDGNGYTVYNSGCVADSGSRGYYTPGVGSVVVVQGAWISDLYGVNQSAPNPPNVVEAPYFASLMGKNTPGNGLGFAKYTVSVDRIDVQTYFSGTFQDSFSIWAGPNPVPYPTWTPANPQVGQVVTFNATVQGGTPPYSFAWNFGDGVTTTGSTVKHLYTLSQTFNVTLTATDSTNLVGTSRRTIPIGSWNPSVGCSPTQTTVETIVGNIGVLRNATNPNSVGPDYNGGGFRLDGPLPTGSNPSTWPFSKRNLQPPCLVNGTHTFVEVHNVQVFSTPQPGVATYDCRIRFDSSNGGGPLPNGRDCDYVFNVGNPSYSSCPASNSTCDFHRIYSEIDGDWNASGAAPPIPPQGTVLDVQGFVFWDPENLNATTHSFTGWEIHPITAWRIHRAPLSLSFSTSPASPAAGQVTTFTATATGGANPYTYTWDFGDGNTTRGASNQATHTYSSTGPKIVQLFVNDSLGATGTLTKTVTVVAPITVTVTCGTATSGKPVTCNASATGGATPYTFSWSAPGGSPAIGTGSGFTTTYATKGTDVVNATATDNNGAKSFKTTSVVVASQPLTLTVTCGTATAGKPVTCTASATGGASPYIFSWSAPSGNPATGTGTGFTTTYATKGTFVVNATATDGNGAKKSQTASIVVTGQPIVVAATCGAATSGKPVTCNASATGGTAPYTFSWSAPGGSPATGTGASFTTTYATKGTFVVNATATDNNGAKKSQTASIVVTGQVIVVTVTCGTATAGQPVTCNASATGGTAPFTFTWASHGTPATGTGSSYTTTFAAKGPQVVNATARDNNGATKLGQATVNVQGTPLVVTVTCGTTTTGKPVTCNASATGDTPPYTFSWSAPGGNPATGTGSGFTTTYATKGTFVVNATATDGNGTKKSQTASIVVTGQAIVVTVTCGAATTGKPVHCNASATGGTSPYGFSWTSSSSSPSSGSGSGFTTTFPAKGNYAVKAVVIDANGSNSSATTSVTVMAQQLVVDFAFTQPDVAGNPVTFTASVTGGTGPYTFRWSFGDGSPVQQGNPVGHPYAVKGSYSVTLNVTDANSAIVTVQKTVLVTPVALTASFAYAPSAPTPNHLVNFTATVSGGTAPYSTSWDFGDNTTGIGTPVSHMYNISGNYTVTLTVTDANSATATSSKSLTVAPPAQINVTIKVSQAPVAGWRTTFNATATGGTGRYSYLWSFGDGTNGTSQNPRHVYISNGTYTVTLTVTDSSGNTGSTSKQVKLMLNPDVDGSGVVDIVDVANIALAFGSTRGDARYDPSLDLNFDGKIDIIDVALVAFYFGRTVGS